MAEIKNNPIKQTKQNSRRGVDTSRFSPCGIYLSQILPVGFLIIVWLVIIYLFLSTHHVSAKTKESVFDPLNPDYIEGKTVFCTESMSDTKYYKGDYNE